MFFFMSVAPSSRGEIEIEDRSCGPQRPTRTKKADVAEYPEVFDHVGLLFNEPPGQAGLPFI
jgi:hypothetical protein